MWGTCLTQPGKTVSLLSGDTSALSQQGQQLQLTCWTGPTDLATDVCLAISVALDLSLGVAV